MCQHVKGRGAIASSPLLDSTISGDGRNLRLRLLSQLQLRHQTFDALHQTFDAVLELAVLGGVDEWVDATVGERQYHGEVAEPTVEVVRVADGHQKVSDLGW